MPSHRDDDPREQVIRAAQQLIADGERILSITDDLQESLDEAKRRIVKAFLIWMVRSHTGERRLVREPALCDLRFGDGWKPITLTEHHDFIILNDLIDAWITSGANLRAL